MKTHSFLLFAILFSSQIFGQDGIGIGTTTVDPDAILDVSSTSKGIYIPRVSTSDRMTISPSDDTTPPNPGLMVFDTDENAFYFHNGSKWCRMIDNDYTQNQVGNGPVPQGGIIMWSGSTIPQGWALCNGRWYNPEDNTDNGTSSTADRTTRTPDLSGRFVVGLDEDASSTPTNTTAQTLNYGAVGNTGGKNNHVLQEEEMPEHSPSIASAPNHTHSFTTDTEPDHGHGTNNFLSPTAGTGRYSVSTTPNKGTPTHYHIQIPSGGSHNHSGTTSSSGSHGHAVDPIGNDQPHENRPPYYVLAFIMKL